MSAGRSFGNDTAKARKAKAKSPWNRGPNCAGPKAMRSFKEYERKGATRRLGG